VKRDCKLTPRDEELIADLKRIRIDALALAKRLTDQILGEKFECSRTLIEAVDAAPPEKPRYK